MNVGKAIYYLLANSAGVSAITTRIYPEYAPQDADAPFIVYRLTSVDPDDTHDGPAVIDEVRIEVICVSDSYDQAADMGGVARVALDRVYGTYNTVNVESIQFDDVSVSVRDQPRQYAQELTFIVRVKRDDIQIATGSPIEDVTLGRLADVDTTGATDDQVLTYDAASGTWGPEDASTVAAIDDLTDVTITTPANNQALVYNSAAGEWRNDALSLTQLEGISSELGDAIDRQALVYDEAANQWIADGVGQVVIPVRNESRDDSIAIGTVLKATGTQGDRILVAPFEPTDDPKYLIGVASEALGTGADGHAQVYGELRDIDTDAFTIGTVLYAGASGALTSTVGDYPIAIVTRKHPETGRIFIRTWKLGTSRYDDQAEELRKIMSGAVASWDCEYLFTAQADGWGVARNPQSDSVVNSTPAEDYQVERTIYYNNLGLADYVDDSGWTTLTQNTETFAAAKARVDAYIRAATYGGLPLTFAIVRTEEEILTGLLDNYPDAAAAYSLRLLRTGYTGSAIRVRRASDNAEQDIGFDANGDLDTSALATFCSGTDGFVKVWYDQSGNGNDAEQTKTGEQPKIYDSSTGVTTDGGLPVVDCDYTTGTSLSVASPTGFDNMDSCTLLMAANFTLFESNDYHFVLFDTNSLDVVLYNQDSNILNAGAFNPGSGNITQTTSVGRHLVFAGYGNNAQLAIDEISTTGTIDISAYGTSDTLYINRIGPGLHAKAKYHEIICYPSDESTNRSGIETNINDYYSIYTP